MAKKPRKVPDSKGDPVQAGDGATVQQPQTQARQPAKTWSLILDVRVRRAFYLVLLAAMYAPLSQLILSPVYGSIPASVYHKYGIIVATMLSFPIQGYVPARTEKFFGSFVFWVPVIHFSLFRFSSVLGLPWGPLVTECLTTYPIITLSLYFAAQQLAELDLSFLGEGIVEVAPSMLNYFLFTVFARLFRGYLPTWMGLNKLFTRVGFQVMIAATYTAIIPQSYFWPSLPALAITGTYNPHLSLLRTTEVMNNTLALYDYSLVERQESLTGYISVLQDNKNNFRVMRCDHSLLGGEWILPDDPTGKRKLAEPVYAVFTMLEAVRLVERDGPRTTPQEKALNIGLGVGTAPSAMIAHGIDTTIIELDRVVHKFAVKHFSLPQKHLAYTGNAVAVVEMKKDEQRELYDYIIHDVFTGGAEPADLFTFEFLSGLHQMLKPNGAIAINYAGDLAMPSTSLVYRTILEIFPSCRVFREDEQIGDDNGLDENGEFTNMVFICNKGHKPVTFRKAIAADFLGSKSREAYMVPRHEVPASKFQKEGELLTRANTRILEKMHVQSAIGHWKLMRKVIPAGVWENW